MKDSYSFDLDAVSARKTYDLMYATYFKIFKRLGLRPIALRANTGAIGGDLSHEFHILADNGESAIFYDKKFDEISANNDFDIQEMQSIYAMADEMHDSAKCPIAANQLASRRGIEVGHIFNFGEKYSKAMEASVAGSAGDKIYPNMGSYGIGVSRLVGAIIESSHDDKGIIWPEAVAPFQVMLINLKVGDANCDKLCEEIYQKFCSRNIEILYDDSKASSGQKFSIADLIGIPTQVIVGPRGAATGVVEVKNRINDEKKEVAAFNL